MNGDNPDKELAPYRNPALSIEERIEDLLDRMTLEEKAGMMFQTIIAMGQDGKFDPTVGAFGSPSIKDLLAKHMTHFNLIGASSPEQTAEWLNELQKLATSERLGIPVTVSTDPRHTFLSNPGAHLYTEAFSQWPDPTGLAAIGDEQLVEEFADIARQEYIAVGLRMALHPMADLATEPRWGRINGTFGEDAELAGRLTAAYVRGFQGKELGAQSVACMTKHFPGGGPQKDGEDPHFSYGREQVYPGDNFDYHLTPFEHAFAAGTAQIMPYYGMPVGTEHEEVAFGYSKGIITNILRGKYGFDGMVCTNWGLVNDSYLGDRIFPARAWGVEHLSPIERVKKLLDASIDQIGGDAPYLPLQGRPKLYVENIDPDIAGQYGEVVDNVDEADFAILRLHTPYEPRNQYFLEAYFHGGSLEFPEDEKARILDICKAVPTIVDIYLERAAVIPEIAEQCTGLVANFAASSATVLDILFGRFHPAAKLPFELPSSGEAVLKQRSDMPHDSDNPLFEYGFGLTY